jgi:DegV family protein with EDD domain
VDKTQRVAIVTDSAHDLTPELVAELGVIVAPLRLIIRGEVYRDKIDVSPQDFYEQLPELNPLPTTTGVGPEDFRRAYEEGLEKAESVICLVLAEELSVTYAAACNARDLLPDGDVTVIDTRTIIAGQALIVLAAARAAKAGASKEEVIELIEDLIPRVDVLLTVDDLTYLHRGGRLNAPQYYLARILQFKPILRVNHQITAIDRQRSRRKAIDRMLDLVEERVGRDQPIKVALSHALIPEETEAVRQRIEARFNCREMVVLDDMGPVCGAHGGPGSLAVGYYPVGD